MIEIACAIAPMCGMSIFEVMWRLPASVAYQIFYCHLASRGIVLLSGAGEEELLTRLKAVEER